MTSIGYTNLYGSVSSPPNLTEVYGPPKRLITTRGFSSLGFGMQGFIPQALITTNNASQNTDPLETRFILRNAWNTTYPSELAINNLSAAQSPFRIVNNSGDILSRKFYSCGGPTIQQFRPQNRGIKKNYGHIQNQCDGTGVPAASCNTKYVYDSSDFTRYIKQKNIVKNYNLLSNGNNNSSGSQVAYKAIRRY
jgi:hypothetical protein